MIDNASVIEILKSEKAIQFYIKASVVFLSQQNYKYNKITRAGELGYKRRKLNLAESVKSKFMFVLFYMFLLIPYVGTSLAVLSCLGTMNRKESHDESIKYSGYYEKV